MRRRDVLITAGQTVAFALSAAMANRRDAFAAVRGPMSDALQQRLADIVSAYDAQGNHRTGTAADSASAQWLASQVEEAGAKPGLEPFTFSRVDPQSCFVRVANRRIDGVPLFDAAFTSGDGVQG